MSIARNNKLMVASGNTEPFIKIIKRLSLYHGSETAAAKVMGVTRNVLRDTRTLNRLSYENGKLIMAAYEDIKAGRS